MKRLVLALVSCIALAPSGAQATALGYCCACAQGNFSHTDGLQPDPAFFCVESQAGRTPALEARCEQISDQANLICVKNIPGPSCREQLLLDENIRCPASGAPAAAPLGLAALATVLAGLGAFALRRRSSRRA